MKTVILAIGSNVGDKKKNIANAIDLLSQKMTIIQTAPLYVSKAVGYTQQDDFLNTALQVETALTPQELLTCVKNIEKEVGRVQRFHWGPREIDIDIIFYGSLILKTDTLEIPHPRAHERDFVIVPIIDLQPDFVHPVLQKTISKVWGEFDSEKKSLLKIFKI